MNFPIKDRTVINFLIILFFNIVFFFLSAYLLPIHFQTNDDVGMCLWASGAYTGTPEARLVFINVVYGLILSFFYKTFVGIEWYPLFFSIIHITSLSIIVYSFINVNRSRSVKIVSIIFIYILELTIIQNLQFLTTAAIAAFAGTTLLFNKKTVSNIFGIVLFLIGTLVRFDAGMLVMLLMLPCFGYGLFLDWRKNIRAIILVVICVSGAFVFRIIDKQAYKNEEWSYYAAYNAARGQINGNAASIEMIDNLPNDVSIYDFILLDSFFPDGKYMDLQKLNKLKNLLRETSIIAKVRAAQFFLSDFGPIIQLIIITLALCFLSADRRKRIFLFSYFFFLIILIFVCSALFGRIPERLFWGMCYPILFVLYSNVPKFPKKDLINVWIFILVLLNLVFLYNVYVTKIKINEVSNSVQLKEQREILELTRNKDMTIIVPGAALMYEHLCGPFDYHKYYSGLSVKGTGSATNIPYNKGYFDSYLSLLDENIFLFIGNGSFTVPLVQNALIENYGCETELLTVIEKNYYSLIKFVKKQEEIIGEKVNEHE